MKVAVSRERLREKILAEPANGSCEAGSLDNLVKAENEEIRHVFSLIRDEMEKCDEKSNNKDHFENQIKTVQSIRKICSDFLNKGI